MTTEIQRFTDKDIRFIAKTLRLWEWLTSPVYLGLDRIPKTGPALYVANHSNLAFCDMPLFWLKLYFEKKIWLRVLVDHAHFNIPLWRDFLMRMGDVDGTRENCAALMEEGEHILVFPGGAREAFKRRDEQYQLFWEKRLGFARMAIQNQCPIVPVASLGAEECYDIVYDAHDITTSPFGKLLKWVHWRSDLIIPLVKGLGFTLLPKPQRMYFWVGEPIDTRDYKQEHENLNYCTELRDRVQQQVEEGLALLQEHRAADPNRKLLPRLFHRVVGMI